ncbi:unnamed protein product [Phytophthora fragariaefolia]|uniref:Unnamed protein product n=1 Tax=Phytophthora fragariaefolia TaxID=1490495 RepID=A0A9W6U268_9STRA|nr:unnamed protein product [Phytophthora fragariaefolia]
MCGYRGAHCPQVIRGVGAVPITISEETNLTLRYVCFPVPPRGTAAVDAAMAALAAGIADAKTKGASAEFLAEVRDMPGEKLNVFRMALGADPPVDMPPNAHLVEAGRNASVAVRADTQRRIASFWPKCCWTPTSVIEIPVANGVRRLTLYLKAMTIG